MDLASFISEFLSSCFLKFHIFSCTSKRTLKMNKQACLMLGPSYLKCLFTEKSYQEHIRYFSLKKIENYLPHILHSQSKQATVVFINPSELSQTCIKSGFLCGKFHPAELKGENKKLSEYLIVKLRTTLQVNAIPLLESS